MIFFNYSGYETNLDRILLVAVPVLAIAYLVFAVSPTFFSWLRQRQSGIIITFGLLAVSGGMVVVLPAAVSPVYYLAAMALAIVLFALMLPASLFVEGLWEKHSIWHYCFGFLFGLFFAYGAVGFLADAIKTTFNMLLFTAVLVLTGNILGYYLVRRVNASFHNGFLSRPLNIALCAILPLLLFAIIYIGVQFPSMFVLSYISVPSKWLGLFFASALIAGVWGAGVLEQAELRGFDGRLKRTRFFMFIRENLPGMYAGGLFFLINLIIARALNHPALNINTVLFESDAGPWMIILGSPEGDVVNRSVHPLILITARPLVRFVATLMAEQWNLAAMLVVAALSGLCVFMAWLFVRRAVGDTARTYAFIFALLLGSTATNLFFGSITDTYVFGMTSLIFFFLLIQIKEQRFFVLIPAGVLLFGVTVTNIAQGVIGLFFNRFGFTRLVRLCVYILMIGIVLTAFTSAIYPNRQTFFYVPADILFEKNFVKPVNGSLVGDIREKFKIVSRTMFLYGVVGPRPIEAAADKPPRPTIDLKTFDSSNHLYASYKGFSNIPLSLWLTFFAGSFLFFVIGFRSSLYTPLMLGLLGSLGFNFVLHMNYGTELFLYTPYWVYALIFFTALAYARFADKLWFEILLAVFVITLMVNNTWFIFIALRALAPFYAAV